MWSHSDDTSEFKYSVRNVVHAENRNFKIQYTFLAAPQPALRQKNK